MAEFVSFERVSEHGVTAFRADGSAAFIEPGHDLWEDVSAAAGPYVDPPADVDAVAQARQARRAAFEREADPLFFKWQAGEGNEADWLAAREAIRARYPYPE